ncbi:MAG: DUF454 domain-containing protein [Tissierellia bacterium]|nr:DUF454 domain-containing protein [Tissierellia bacterium]
MKNKFRNSVYIVLGFIFLSLGAVGVILPVLPTTPFLLLASYFFSRGSVRFNNWFLSTKLYKNHLEDFVATRSMTMATKVKLLSFASSVLLVSAYIVKLFWVRVFIGFIIVFKYYYFTFHIKTIKPETKREVAIESKN